VADARRVIAAGSVAAAQARPGGVAAAAAQAAASAAAPRAVRAAPAPAAAAPAKTLDTLFRKTLAPPALYWLPLTEEAVARRMARDAEAPK
jgi:hypothetical protein